MKRSKKIFIIFIAIILPLTAATVWGAKEAKEYREINNIFPDYEKRKAVAEENAEAYATLLRRYLDIAKDTDRAVSEREEALFKVNVAIGLFGNEALTFKKLQNNKITESVYEKIEEIERQTKVQFFIMEGENAKNEIMKLEKQKEEILSRSHKRGRKGQRSIGKNQ